VVRPSNEVTTILSAVEQGDPAAVEQLLPLVYDELRKLAAERMAREKLGQTLQATVLVHEAYLRLVDVERAEPWNGRGHFFFAAAEAMRRGRTTASCACHAPSRTWRRANELRPGTSSRRSATAAWTASCGRGDLRLLQYRIRRRPAANPPHPPLSTTTRSGRGLGGGAGG
jgi:hypothetical protein